MQKIEEEHNSIASIPQKNPQPKTPPMQPGHYTERNPLVIKSYKKRSV
jgi:hypothetical protein